MRDTLESTLSLNFFYLFLNCATCLLFPSFAIAENPEPLVITSLTPSRGLASTETLITIQGEGIQQGASVRIGDRPVIPMAYFPPKSLTVYSPPGLPGAVDVTLTNPDKQFFTLKEGFHYVRDLSDFSDRDKPIIEMKRILSVEPTSKERLKSFLGMHRTLIMKASVYGGLFLLILVAFSLNRKKRVIKRIRSESKITHKK